MSIFIATNWQNNVLWGGYTDITDLFANMAICRSLFNIDFPHYINIAVSVCFALAAALNLWYYRRNAAVRFIVNDKNYFLC